MRVTKFVHACILAETSDRVALIDPGQFSWESGLFNLNKIERIDRVIITHEHFDHFHKPFVEALAEKFPSIKIITTDNVASQLGHLKVQEVTTRSTSCTELITNSPHESMAPLNPVDPPCENVAINFKDLLTHPGDSLQIKETKPIFCMPLAGPWGSAVDGIKLATRLKPKVVLPIHDWMWNDVWRNDMYERLEDYFDKIGIRFIAAIDGEPVEIDI